jgi:hypothetical protein
VDFHIKQFSLIANELKSYTKRCIISIVDMYPKASSRFNEMAEKGIKIYSKLQIGDSLNILIPDLVRITSENKMELFSCSEEIDLARYGVKAGKCIDNEYIRNCFGIDVINKKDPFQRKECGCVISKDIGMYDTCLFGCKYCYATQSFKKAKTLFDKHNPNSPSLIGWHENNVSDKKIENKIILPLFSK